MRKRPLLAIAMATAGLARGAGAVELMPILGVGVPTGRGSDSFGAGLHSGISVGGHLSPRLSLHGQFEWALLNPNDVPDGANYTGVIVLLSVAPLFHLLDEDSSADIVLGPTMGVFGISEQLEFLGETANASVQGFHLGLAAAAYFRVSRIVRLGPYLEYNRLWADKVCVEFPGTSEVCDDDPDNDDEGFFSLGGSAKFF